MSRVLILVKRVTLQLPSAHVLGHLLGSVIQNFGTSLRGLHARTSGIRLDAMEDAGQGSRGTASLAPTAIPRGFSIGSERVLFSNAPTPCRPTTGTRRGTRQHPAL